MVLTVPTEQKDLKAFIKRRHPDYEANAAHWVFLAASYRGGRSWFKINIFKYVKEGEKEFKDRLKRAFRFNHTREVVDLVNKYIFRAPVHRNEDGAGEQVRDFWKKATRSGLTISQYMEQVSQLASIYGRIWVVVDSNATEETVSKADEKEQGIGVYSYTVKPEWALDMAYDEDNELEWILLYEPKRDDSNPFTSSGAWVENFRLWTRDEWILFRKTTKGRAVTVTVVGRDAHDIGRVPVFRVDHVPSDNAYTAPALIGEVAYLDRAIANYLSNLDAIIQDQTFSQLAMPAQGMLPGEDGFDKLIEMGTKRIFTFDGEHGTRPEYLSPDPKQAQLIIEVINKVIAEIYHSIGLSGERTTQDNAVGIDNSSGVAKAFDFDKVNALLAAKAASLDDAENKLVALARKWHGIDTDDDEDLVKYPDDYDVRGLYDEFDVAMRLGQVEAPETMRKEQMKLIIEKLFPRIAKVLKDKMLSEVKDWDATVDAGLRPTPDLSKESRQGQVTSDEDDKPTGG